MNFFVAIITPIVSFLLTYKWYFIIAIILYILLTTIFKFARGAITIVFGIIVLFFLITHIGSVFGAINTAFEELGNASTAVSNEYSNVLVDKVITDDSLTPGEKVTKATEIFFGLDADDSQHAGAEFSGSGSIGQKVTAIEKQYEIDLGLLNGLRNIASIYVSEFYTLVGIDV